MIKAEMKKTFFKDTVLPRISFPLYWITRIILIPLGVFFFSKVKRETTTGNSICLEAGAIGWLSIEFKELYTTACEYIGKERVQKVVIQKDKGYFEQVKEAVNQHKPNHYFYDPRTGNQNWFKAIVEAFRIVFLFSSRGIIPIVLLADYSYRTWRVQAVILTALRGVVISFLAPSEGYPLFPHNRIVAPNLMPLSMTTLSMLDKINDARPKKLEKKALFVGSLYEPRTTFLKSVATILKTKKLTLEIRGRIPGEHRKSDEEYWKILSHSAVIVTTAEQIDLPINDWKWITQLTYRYLETLAAGTLLIAPEVPGIKRYFIPGEHFISYNSIQDAVEKIQFYLTNKKEREKIAACGRERARQLIMSRIYWLSIDTVLGKDSLT
ncbi:MAG: glycosyltransferase family 1 protein [Leptospiraceae bacterium]|nr:glycosyltransferase family 1 protein [Leptospiraceae bacterium]